MVPVTFLLPVYNGEKFLSEALESIQKQTFENFEVLIINDGSSDGTQEIIDSFMSRDARFRCISRENRGLIKSLNEGLDAIKTKYIARMDADDLCHPQRLELQLKYMDANPDIGISGTNTKYFGLKETDMNYPVEHEKLVALLPYVPSFCHPSVIIRREVLEKNSLRYDEQFIDSEDYKLWLDLSDVTRFGSLPHPLLYYRTHGESICDLSSVQNDNCRIIRRLIVSKLGLTLPSVMFHSNFTSGRYDKLKLEYWPIYLKELLAINEHYYRAGFLNFQAFARQSFPPEHAEKFISCVKEAVEPQNDLECIMR